MVMLAEIEMAEGHLNKARDHAVAASTLEAVTNITYQQALASRALGLIDAAAGDTTAAVTHLTERSLWLGARPVRDTRSTGPSRSSSTPLSKSPL